jgi:hypothetical protein
MKNSKLMGKVFNPVIYVAIIFGLSCFSCASSRYHQGFSYQPVYAGPDMASGLAEESETPAPITIMNIKDENTTQIQGVTATENTEQSDELVNIISREYQVSLQSGQIPESRETLRKIATEYAASQDIQLTGKQLRKLDRYAAKMDKKQQRGAQDVNWGPSNNLEWFILLGAGAGLVVGIFGIGFGWFVFLGLALVYLYFKLLKNN